MQLNATYKGFPGHLAPIDLADVGAQQWQVLQGDLPFPLAVIRQTALEHNLHWMQNFCNERDLDIAPHGKTTLSPELYHLQLDAGAWGISFATVWQLGVGVQAGVRRAIIASSCDVGSRLLTGGPAGGREGEDRAAAGVARRR